MFMEAERRERIMQSAMLGLLHLPKLVILDEPTGGPDPLMQQIFFEIQKEEK